MLNHNCFCGCCLDCSYKEECVTAVNQRIDISTPVEIEANAHIKGTKIKCGKPKLSSYSKPRCCYKKNTCEFIVFQTLCVKIPISYSVKAKAGASFIDCNSDEHHC